MAMKHVHATQVFQRSIPWRARGGCSSASCSTRQTDAEVWASWGLPWQGACFWQ